MRSADELKVIDKLKAERWRLLTKYNKLKTFNEKQPVGMRINTVNAQLYDLTENEIYNK